MQLRTGKWIQSRRSSEISLHCLKTFRFCSISRLQWQLVIRDSSGHAISLSRLTAGAGQGRRLQDSTDGFVSLPPVLIVPLNGKNRPAGRFTRRSSPWLVGL